MYLIEHLNEIIQDEEIKNERVDYSVVLKLNEHLPQDFVEFYSYFGNSDVIISADIGEEYHFGWFYPLSEGIDPIPSIIETYDGRMPSWIIPFSPDFMGNQFVISVREKDYGSIYLWEHDYEYDEDEDDCPLDEYEGNLVKISDSFSEFILSMVPAPED